MLHLSGKAMAPAEQCRLAGAIVQGIEVKPL